MEIPTSRRDDGITERAASLPVIARRGRGYQIVSSEAGYRRLGAIPLALIHLLALGALFTGVTPRAAACFAVLYVMRILGVTVAYHRYFSHRSFRTSRVFQFLLAVFAQFCAQKGVLWYASQHRHHHRYSDTDLDVHSPRHRGLFYAHIGWLFDSTDDTDMRLVRDLARYPELRWIDRYWLLPPVLLGLAVYLFAGPSGLFFGFFFNNVVTLHVTLTVASLAHRFGHRRFETKDDSRNNVIIAVLMLGEGWHNNHHHIMWSARQGFAWWEIDVTYYVLKLLERLGLIWGLREPSPELLRQRLAISKERA